MNAFSANTIGLLVALIAIILILGWSFWLPKQSERTRAFLKILVAVIVIGYTWIPFDGEKIYYSILVTVFALYVISNEYKSGRKLSN
jgi:hypothetical protein